MVKRATKKKVSTRKPKSEETPARVNRVQPTNTPKESTKMSEEMETMLEFSEDIGEATLPPPLPSAQYLGEIRSAEVKVSANSGNRYADIVFCIDPTEFPADFEGAEDFPEGMILHYRRLLVEDDRTSRARLRKFIEAIGASTGAQIDMNSWVGLQARLALSITEFNGEQRNDIAAVTSAD